MILLNAATKIANFSRKFSKNVDFRTVMKSFGLKKCLYYDFCENFVIK